MIESLIEYGFVPEFAGRFPIIVPLAPLTKEQMRRALVEPKNSVIKQQVELFRRDGIALDITDEALDAIVDKAVNIKTGVRALRSLVKGMTSKARYDLAGDSSVTQVIVGPETLEDAAKYEVSRREAV
jgi:ATP-dependent Clp protease ATP-binding subunit ClpX